MTSWRLESNRKSKSIQRQRRGGVAVEESALPSKDFSSIPLSSHTEEFDNDIHSIPARPSIRNNNSMEKIRHVCLCPGMRHIRH